MPPPLVIVERRVSRPSTRPATSIGPVPGSSEKSNDRSANAAIDARGGVDASAARGRAEQRHLQAAVFLQLEAVIGRHGLADGEADLLAAVVHAAPLRGRAVAREIGREVGGRRLEIGAVHEHAPSTRPRRTRKARKAAGSVAAVVDEETSPNQLIDSSKDGCRGAQVQRSCTLALMHRLLPSPREAGGQNPDLERRTATHDVEGLLVGTGEGKVLRLQ